MLEFVRDCLVRQRLSPPVYNAVNLHGEGDVIQDLLRIWADHGGTGGIWYSVSDLLLFDAYVRDPGDSERLEFYCDYREKCKSLRVPGQQLDEERLLASTCLAMLDLSSFGFNEALATVPDVEPVTECADKLGSFLARAPKCHFKPSNLKELKAETVAYLSSEGCAHLW